MSVVNVDAVFALLEINLSTLMASLVAQDTSLIRTKDGTAPSPEQLDLVMKATRADLEAANDYMRHAMDDVLSDADAAHRCVELMRKYTRDPDATTRTVLPLMSPEDRDEFTRLMLRVAST